MKSLKDEIQNQVWGQVWKQVGDQVRDQVWREVGDQVRDQVQVDSEIYWQIKSDIGQKKLTGTKLDVK